MTDASRSLASPRIELRQVTFGYDERHPILERMSLSLTSGLTLVVGPNGAGKSTLLRLLAGVEPPQNGSIEIEDHDLWVDEIEARRKLAYVPEHPDLTPYASVRATLELVAALRREPPSAVDQAMSWMGLEGFGHRSPKQLSLGQRRRILLAAAGIGHPSCLLLDEPLESLDRQARQDILSWITQLLAADAAVLVVSHLLEPFLPLAAHVLGLSADGWRFDHASAAGELDRQLVERLARGES